MIYYNMKTIDVNSMISLQQGVTPDEGKPICDKIKDYFNQGEVVELNFAGVKLMTTAFLNVAIGDLYGEFSSEVLKEKLKIVNISDDDARRIKKVTDTAKLFYADKESFNKSVEDLFNGKN